MVEMAIQKLVNARCARHFVGFLGTKGRNASQSRKSYGKRPADTTAYSRDTGDPAV